LNVLYALKSLAGSGRDRQSMSDRRLQIQVGDHHSREGNQAEHHVRLPLVCVFERVREGLSGVTGSMGMAHLEFFGAS